MKVSNHGYALSVKESKMLNMVLEFITEKLLFIIISLSLFILWKIFKPKIIKRKYKINPLREMVFAVFYLYLTILTAITIVPDYEITSTGIHFTGLQITWSLSYFSRHTNLIPFAEIYKMFVHASFPVFIINILGNISVFVPLGLTVPLLWKAGIKKVMLLGLSSSCLIEISQLLQNRTTDIDDIILNTFGCLLGFMLYGLIKNLSPSFCERFK